MNYPTKSKGAWVRDFRTGKMKLLTKEQEERLRLLDPFLADIQEAIEALRDLRRMLQGLGQDQDQRTLPPTEKGE